MQKELQLRIISGILLAVVALAATWAGGIAFSVLAIVIALLVYSEWSTITRLGENDLQGNAFGWLSQVVIAGLVLLGEIAWTLPVLGLSTVVAIAWVLLRKGSWWLPGGIVYAGLTGISLSAIRDDAHIGLIAMIFVFAVVWATDILAYFVGRAIGGPKLAPKISPGKTWSGAIGGALSGVLAGTAVYMVEFSSLDVRIPILAAVLSVFSQIGDLFESFIKRRFGVKDSGRIIPGHGGVMDRVDGLVFASFAALFVALMTILAQGAQGQLVGAALLGL
ncbi:phosphatidate cytidylyltransferase [Pararhizobium arenae]|uniref:phosphatidate cytidylyltransferase n=1 Tax=Pararhizobium arenae TaxID=1856850 RepID=UPI00094B48F7|nr:phosphatidate cytidylyltransferase [Pararhizobium arenae]